MKPPKPGDILRLAGIVASARYCGLDETCILHPPGAGGDPGLLRLPQLRRCQVDSPDHLRIGRRRPPLSGDPGRLVRARGDTLSTDTVNPRPAGPRPGDTIRLRERRLAHISATFSTARIIHTSDLLTFVEMVPDIKETNLMFFLTSDGLLCEKLIGSQNVWDLVEVVDLLVAAKPQEIL